MAESAFVPISDSDFSKLQYEDREQSDVAGPYGQWRSSHRSSEVQSWYRPDTQTNTDALKFKLTLNGITSEEVYQLLTDLQLRLGWNTDLETMEILEWQDEEAVVYWRDALLKVATRHEGDQILMVAKDTTHPKAPIVPGVIRVETFLSGCIIRPLEGDPSSSTLTVLQQLDFKGWIPKCFISSRFMAYHWYNNMTGYYSRNVQLVKSKAAERRLNMA
ncbi:steroidogenic acute regulatory protein, mitochondrial-like isoform X2 [Corticium candelabrum]|uniref:steroidogenic acute regulatory protein, mitochondrial-like isoform X2 n=1 Tax=Corticium candelabrum TaxID=121492 RepID=UPI002E265784|nr:steroidogenic acute regulatory protein, mitochondrial-like isoform X2 [Corticium candelabrum]